MSTTEISLNLTKLNDIRKKLGEDYYARVGILGSDAMKNHKKGGTKYDTKTGKASRSASKEDSGMTNSEIGVIHEFGSDTAGIPPRSFLRMPIETHSANIIKAMKTEGVKAAVESLDAVKVFKILGVIAEGWVKTAFETGGFGKWAPLKEETKKAKGSSAPLIDTGQLRRSITSDVAKKGIL